MRPGALLDTVPGDAVLVALSFQGVTVDRVRVDQAGVPADRSTYVVPEATDQVDLPPALALRSVETILAGKTVEAADAGTMTLRYASGGAQFTLSIPLDLGEGTSLQTVAYVATDTANRKQELMTHLQANRAYYTRAVLAGLDSAALVMLLSAFTWRGRPLADQVEPNPLAVSGNFLVLRAPVEDGEPSGIGGNGATWGALIRERALTSEQQDARLVPIPTGGVFAEAVLGRSNSAEKLDITRFWNWQDSPIPLQPPEISPVGTGSRASAEDLRPGQLGAPVLNILNPTALPDPAGLGAVLNTLASANLFRDMSGLAGTQALAQAGAAGTLSAATAAGQLASQNLKTVTDQAVAMGQAAADMWKTLHAPGGGGGSAAPGGKGSSGSVSNEGARINHGRDMDERGVTGPTAGPMSLPATGSDGQMSESPDDVMPGVEGGSGMPPARSRELSFADIGAAGVSPAFLSDVVTALGGTLAKAPQKPQVTPLTEADILNLLKADLVAIGVDAGKDFKPVTLTPMDRHVNGTAFIDDAGFSAWTQSDKEIYVSIGGFEALVQLFEAKVSHSEAVLQARAIFILALRHEACHLIQFKAGGGRPKTFPEMARFEKQAYNDSHTWVTSGKARKYLESKLGAAVLKRGLLPAETEKVAAAFKHAKGFFDKLTASDDAGYRDQMRKGSAFLPNALGTKTSYKVDELYDGPKP